VLSPHCSPLSWPRPLGLQLREEIDGVEHLAVRVIELEHADIDQPHREHLGHAVAAGHAPTTVDADVFLDIGHLNGIRPEFEEVAGDQGPNVGGVHVQTHGRQPPVACSAGGSDKRSVANDFLSIGAEIYRADSCDERRLSQPGTSPPPTNGDFIVRPALIR
jgi:hypothetical protein